MASTTLARAESFSRGATESSRSRNDMSAGTVGAFSRKRSFDPGVEKHDRRGRFRLRWDMHGMLPAAPVIPLRWVGRGPASPGMAVGGLRSQVGGHELLAQELTEAGGVSGHELAAQP
jgi:hypothetical protein